MRLKVLFVTNVPFYKNPGKIIYLLKKMSRKWEGKCFKVGQNKAVIHFPTSYAAAKAQKEINKKYIYGEELSVTFFCGADFCVCTCPAEKSEIETSNISSNSKWNSCSITSENVMQKNEILERFHSKFHLSPVSEFDKSIFTSTFNNRFQEENMNPDTSLMSCKKCMQKLQRLLLNIITLLKENGLKIRLSFFMFLYKMKYGITLCISDYGFEDLCSLLNHFPYNFKVREKEFNRTVFLLSDNTEVLNDFLKSYTSRPIMKSDLRGSSDLIDSKKVSACQVKRENSLSVDSKSDVNSDLANFEILPVFDLNYNKRSPFYSRTVPENGKISNRDRRCISNTITSFTTSSVELENSMKKSSPEIITLPETSLKSPLVLPDVRDIRVKIQSYSEKYETKYFQHDTMKFKMRQKGKFTKSANDLLQNHYGSKHLKGKMKEKLYTAQKFYHSLNTPHSLNCTREVPFYSKINAHEKCLHDPPTFTSKPDVKFDKNSINSITDDCNSEILVEQREETSYCHRQFRSHIPAFKSEKNFSVTEERIQNVKSTLMIEKLQVRRSRIAAKFAVPIL